MLRGRWCHIVVLNVHFPTEDKPGDLKNSFYKELWEEISNPLIWNESLHEIGNDNGVRLVNVATSKNPSGTSRMFPHRNIRKCNINNNLFIKMDVCLCVCVCMFGHNSGTPGAISTKLGTHMAVCMCKDLMHISYIYILSPKHHFQQQGRCGRPPCYPPPPQGLPIAAAVTLTQIGIEATA
jgi:hypothetical protein